MVRLHLYLFYDTSGNGFVGYISTDVVISESLSTLSLSHNELMGDIPPQIQNRPWTALDLSYNKFTGDLSSSYPALSDNSSLSLQVNRLSGDIPHSLKYATNIELLSGNVFDCSYDRRELPVNDHKSIIYECGSDDFDRAAYTWIAAVCMVVATVLLVACMVYANTSVF